ncbi:hypothetical protein BDV32DRAFT_132215 [Aspergillus pseudonomiae]|nr:hypothetical protein BDV32DRAFT_132215 [Aspergillus pseudonomiae]
MSHPRIESHTFSRQSMRDLTSPSRIVRNSCASPVLLFATILVSLLLTGSFKTLTAVEVDG